MSRQKTIHNLAHNIRNHLKMSYKDMCYTYANALIIGFFAPIL
jgi:hypothetical protein